MERKNQIPVFVLIVLALVLGLRSATIAQDSIPDRSPRLSETTAARVWTEEFVPGSVLVRLADPTADVASARGAVQVLGVAPRSVQSVDALPGVYQLQVEPGDEAETATRLRGQPPVLAAEPDYLFFKETTPDDSLYPTHQWNLRQIRADVGWDRTTGSSDVVIAIVDTGVDLTHPDLAGKLVPGYDPANGDFDPSDDDGHGTHVASIAAANSNDGRGVAGVSWHARIMPIKALRADGSGSGLGVARGIVWAVDNGADIINLSLGGANASFVVEDAINYAHARGVLVVAAAGNHYQEGNPVTYPAAYPHVLAVAATDDNDGHASYSSSGSYVDVAAPGGDPSSSNDDDPRHWIPGAYWRGAGSDYAWLSGTSQAAPHVAGLAALLLSLDPTLTPDELTQSITGTATDVLSPGWDEFSGNGRIDVDAALRTVPVSATATPTNTPTASPTPTATPTPTPPPRPRQDVRINSSLSGRQSDPALAGDPPGNLVAVWRDEGADGDLLSAASQTTSDPYWGANVTLAGSQKTQAGSAVGAPDAVVAADGSIYVAWYGADDAGEVSVFVSRRQASSLTWTTPVSVAQRTWSTMPATRPAIGVAADGTTLLVWEEMGEAESDVPASTLYWSERAAGAQEWRTPRPIHEGVDAQTSPDLAIHDGVAYLTWIDRAGNRSTVTMAQRPVGAEAWSTPVAVAPSTPALAASSPTIGVVDGGAVLVAWSDRRSATGGTAVYVARRSPADGAWSAPQRIDRNPGTADQHNPQLAISARGVALAWEDTRRDAGDIYIVWGNGLGDWTSEQIVNQDAAGTQQITPAVALDGHGHTTVAWADHRTGSDAPEIYARFIPAGERFKLYLSHLER